MAYIVLCPMAHSLRHGLSLSPEKRIAIGQHELEEEAGFVIYALACLRWGVLENQAPT